MNNDTLALLIPILAVFMGGLVLLVPVAGFTARYAFKPMVEAIARFKESQGSAGEVRLLEQRVALLEQQLQGMEGTVQQLSDLRQFDRELSAPKQ